MSRLLWFEYCRERHNPEQKSGHPNRVAAWEKFARTVASEDGYLGREGGFYGENSEYYKVIIIYKDRREEYDSETPL